MKHLLILGAGTAGTILANRMARRLPSEWNVVVVEPEDAHLYQPGLAYVPFGKPDDASVHRARSETLGQGVVWQRHTVDSIAPDIKVIRLANGHVMPYELLVIATGARPRPDLTPGLTGPGWRSTIFDFYTLDGARALAPALAGFTGGRLVVHIAGAPIKSPAAPLEFAFMADDFFSAHGLRDKLAITVVTPGAGAFPTPLAAERFGILLAERGIGLETGFVTERVDGAARRVYGRGGREIGFDLLVTVPAHTGAACIEQSGFGDAAAFVPTDPRTLAVRGLHDVFAVGDATDLPTAKVGSVAHFESELLGENLLRAIAGKPPLPVFDGHANCFVETGHGKAMLLDYNYDVEPVPGDFPVPGMGPFSLLRETRVNRLGKSAVQWMYWNRVLLGRGVPVTATMSKHGKDGLPFAEESA